MATPANRVPVRIARGSKANLDTAIAAGDLKEGEICYASDQNSLYMVESSTLESTIEVATDITPQLGGNLDVNGNYIVSASGGNVEIAPDTTGDFIIRGNDTDGSITLNCTTNAHAVKIQSPPHSAAATYTLVLPDTTGTNGQLLTTDGSGGLSWSTAAGVTGRSTVTQTTASIADGTSDNITFSSTGKSGQFIKVETDRAAWVTLYNTTAARTADSARAETTDPDPGSGVLLEVITTGAEIIQITPTAGYYNDETTPLSELYAKVVNKSGATSTVQVDITLVDAET